MRDIVATLKDAASEPPPGPVVKSQEDETAAELMHLVSHRGRISSDMPGNRRPKLVSLCVLALALQDSVKIRAELLPAEYFELINELWQTLDAIFEAYGGICGKPVGEASLYYFIKQPDTNYVMDTIYCALKIKAAMKRFSKEWKIRKGWIDDICLTRE